MHIVNLPVTPSLTQIIDLILEVESFWEVRTMKMYKYRRSLDVRLTSASDSTQIRTLLKGIYNLNVSTLLTLLYYTYLQYKTNALLRPGVT